MTYNALKTQVSELETATGLGHEDRRQVAEALSKATADTYRVFVMTQGVHWNVQGPLFYSVHKLTEDQYQDMFEAIDDLAERVRAIGFPAPQSVTTLMGDPDLKEPDPAAPLHEQIEALAAANEQLARSFRNGVRMAEEHDDVKTADLLTDRIGLHEENVWMLRATIAE